VFGLAVVIRCWAAKKGGMNDRLARLVLRQGQLKPHAAFAQNNAKSSTAPMNAVFLEVPQNPQKL
jgi:hypothetical protein